MHLYAKDTCGRGSPGRRATLSVIQADATLARPPAWRRRLGRVRLALPLSGDRVLIVGPDGSGKSTLATALAERVSGVHIYWRPGMLPMAGRIVGKRLEPGVNHDPHGQKLNSPIRSAVRVLYYLVDFTLGDLVRLRFGAHHRDVVVVERGWLDMIIDPQRYRLRSNRLCSLLQPLVPKADLLVLVVVPPEVAYARKAELPLHEIERQYMAWRSLDRGFRNRIELDGQAPVGSALAEILGAIGQKV